MLGISALDGITTIMPAVNQYENCLRCHGTGPGNAAGGRSMAGNTDNGGLRSYGSMTYAGLKSMIYCGVTPDDPRVKAAVTWAKKHYTLDENPGMADAGLYYYYNLFGKALRR